MNDADKYKKQHDYESAGFNGFFRRSIGSVAGAQTLRSISNTGRSTALNFDDQQISGALGDNLKIGSIRLNGKTGQFDIVDDQGNVVVRIGTQED